VAQRLLDSLEALPYVRRESFGWQMAYRKAHQAALNDSAAAVGYHQALLHSQVAFSGQQLLLNEQRLEKDKFKARAHRKGWVIAGLLAVLGAFIYFH
jgi:hypothetical protein